MKKGIGKRLISMMVAICMILTVCPVSALAGDVGDSKTITASVLVAGAYGDLSQEEKTLIGSGLLVDVTYEYYVPGEGDNLIVVDTEKKTVTAAPKTDKNGNVWNPVGADIIANGSSVETVTPDGVDTYEYDGNAFSVEVSYEMYISVAIAVQEQLLNTSGWLKDGVANLDNIAALAPKLGALETAMPELVKYAGMEIPVTDKNGNPLTTVTFSEGFKTAVADLDAQMDANGDKLKLSSMIVDYKSGAKTKYLLTGCADMRAELPLLADDVNTLAEGLTTLNDGIAALGNFGMTVDAATIEALALLTGIVNDLNTGLAEAKNGDWTAADKGTALVKADMSDADYATLDTLVAALGTVKTAADITITESILAADTTIKHNLSMWNVTVKVMLNVVEDAVDSDKLVSGGDTEEIVLTLADKATKAEIEAALAASNVVNDAIVAWGEAYKAEHYVSTTTVLPDTLTEDIEYTITYSPVDYTITYAYDEGTTKDVPYGYQTRLEGYADSSKVYDYTVNGDYLPQGAVYTVVGDVTITRQTGKPYTTTDLYTAIAGMEGVAEKEKAILTAGALQGNTVVINVRYPDTDAGSLVSVDSNLVLTGKTYASDYAGLIWAPYNYVVTAGDGTDAAPASFTQNGDTYTAQITDSNYESIKVYYRLSLANFDENAAQTALDLVEQLVAETETQNEALASLSSPAVSDNLGMLNDTLFVVLDSLIEKNDLHEDADKSALLKTCFTAVIDKMEADCLDSSGNPRITGLISNYISATNKLAYYYRNSESFITEVSLLSRYLNELLAEDANLTADNKLAALAVLIGKAPGLSEEQKDRYTQKLPELQQKMNDINAKLLPVNAAIDTTSPNLVTLTNALQMTGTVGTDYDDYVYLQSQSFNVAGSGKIILKVNVIYGEDERSVSETVEQNAPVTQTAIDSLKAKVAALRAEMDIDDDFWYGSNAYAGGDALDALVGQAYAANKTLSFTWVKLERTPCEINGHDEQIIRGKAATCTATGLTDGVWCTVCEETLVEQQEIPKVDHTKQTLPAVEPSCTAPGKTAGEQCSVCGETLVAQETIAQLEHDYSGEWVNDESDHWHVCKLGCGSVDGKVSHSYDTNDCTKAAKCTTCGFDKEPGTHNLLAPEYVDAAEHKRVCSSCKIELKFAHEWGEPKEEKPDTCEEAGYKKYTCACGAEKTEEGKVLEHSWGPWTEFDGETHYRVCEKNTTEHCRESGSHTWVAGQPNSDGEVIHTCTGATGCGATKTVVQNRAEKLEAGTTIKAALTPDQNGAVVLPKPSVDDFDGPGYRYDYVVDGVTYKVTNDSIDDPIYPSSVAGATVTLVNIDNENLEILQTAMGNGAVLETKTDLAPTNDGYYTGLKVETDAKGLMGVVQALVLQEALGADKYGYVALGNEPLLNNNKVSLLGLLRMMMKDIDPDPDKEVYAYTSQDIIGLSNGTNKILIDNKLVLRDTAPSTYALRSSTAANDGHELAFQLLLTTTPAQLGELGAALVSVQDYITFDIKAAYENDVLVSDRLDIDIKAKLPAKVYEIYVAALRLTGNVDVNDANAVKEAVAYAFLKDYVEVLLGTDVNTTTLMNTAAKLGKTVDLAEYEGIFNVLKGKLDYGRGFTYSADGLSATATFTHDEMEKAVDKLEPMIGDGDLLDLLKSLLVECQDGETVDIKLNAFVTNFTDGDDADDFIDTDYEAIVIDVEAAKKSGLIEKAGVFDITEDLATSVAGLKGDAAVMLQQDVAADLHFKNTTTILDLNGHTIDGAITADGKLIIMDSQLAPSAVGRVTGAITGSDITILAGTYDTDVSSYLKLGYVQQSGTVKNEYYEIKKVGNDITFEISADILNTRELPSVRWLAAEMAADLAMNHFTASSLALADENDTGYQNAYSVFMVNFDNLLTLISQTTDGEKVDALLDTMTISGANGVEGFINDLLAKSMDFGALAAAIDGDTALIKYNMATMLWDVKLVPVAGEDYLTVGVEPGEKVYGSVAVTVVGTQENKDKIEALLTEMGKIMVSDPAKNSVTVTLQDPAYADKTLTVTGSGNATINIDMSGNPDYAAVAAVILAKSGVNKQEFVDALTAYFADSSDTDALHKALAKVTLAQGISAVKRLSLSEDFTAMLADLNVSSGTGNSVVELGDTFHMALVAAGRLLNKLKIDGDSRILFGASGENTYTNSNVTRDIAYVVAGITLSGLVTAENISVNVKLFPAICEHDWGAWTDLGNGQHERVCSKNTNHKETAAHTDANGDNLCDNCPATICDHSWGAWTDLGNGQHERVCSKNADHKETAAHADTNSDNRCDACGASLSSGGGGGVGGGGGGGSSTIIEVLNADKGQVLKTDSFAAAVEAAKEGYTIKVSSAVTMKEHAYVSGALTITGAGKLNDTGYVIYLNDAAAKTTADAQLNIGSGVEGYKVICTEKDGTFTYTLEKINAPKTDVPVAGSKVETINNKLYLLLDLHIDGMDLNALRENIAFSDLAGTIKIEIEGNDGTGLIKTKDRMTVSTYNADNNCVATVNYVVIVMGDTNCNGRVSTSDATLMKSINFGETYELEVLIAADVNFSGTYEQPKVNSSDATYIMSKYFDWSTGKYTTNLE